MHLLLPNKIFYELSQSCLMSDIKEIRIRLNKNVVVYTYKKTIELKCIADFSDVEHILQISSNFSLYAVNDYLIKGYLMYKGGVRIGVCGEGVVENNKLITVKNINALCIRLPHNVEISDTFVKKAISINRNILVVAPPGGGKTTLIREIGRLNSNNGVAVLFVDERGELSATQDGIPFFDVGKYSDIALGIPKNIIYESMVRSMRPELIVIDEVFGESEINAILDCVRSGVKVVASVHSDSIEKLKNDKMYSKLISCMNIIILLGTEPAGKILGVVEC